MNYDFLQSYNMSVTHQNNDNLYVSSSRSNMTESYGTYQMQSSQSTPAVNTDYYGYGGPSTYNNYHQSAVATTSNADEYYRNSDRFIPSSEQGTGYVPYTTPFKRKYKGAAGGSAAKKEPPIEEVTNDGKLVMFLGRDESYPDELNSLIHPLSCELCNVKMNSKTIAKDHYESKVHDKHISSWLFKNYTEKGVNPPTVKRFVKQGPTGPDAFYCEHCDLKLTSLTHANQHYAGKKHRLVISQRSKPSGAGFYNSEGKWVRIAKKGKSKDQRFGIGESFKLGEILTSTGTLSASSGTITSVADTTTNNESDVKKAALTSNIDQDPALFCSYCKVSVTSAVQMNMHLSGSKHMKKLNLAGITPTEDTDASQTNITPAAIKEEIKSDPDYLSMYRTPSGQYYCKTCNISISHLPGLEQHLYGKRHLKRLTEENAKAALAAKKI